MSISVFLARGLLDEVERRGLATATLLAHAGIDAARLQDPQQILDLDELRRLVVASVALTSDPGIGLAIFEGVQPQAEQASEVMLSEAAEELLRQHAQLRSLGDRVRTLLRGEGDLMNVDMREVAGQLALSVHTLRRRLHAEGTSFSALLDDARCQFACQQLRRCDTTIQHTSELLGFSEASAFFRAFKRWTGKTPSEFRRVPELSAARGA